MNRPMTGDWIGLTEKVSCEFGFKRRKSLSMVDGKGKSKTIPGDRANVRKGALSLELLVSEHRIQNLYCL